jgi:hypothetical protein
MDDSQNELLAAHIDRVLHESQAKADADLVLTLPLRCGGFVSPSLLLIKSGHGRSVSSRKIG